MVHENRNGIKLHDYVGRLMEVFGENASVAFCYLLATLFRDIIFRRTRHFPILNLFGEKGTGKTTLATSLQSFFLHGVDPPNLGVTSVPAMNDRVSQAVNTLAVLDEYKNDLDIRKIAYLKGLWGGGGQTKKNTNTDGMAAQTIVTTGVALCGQDKPTQDMALYTRVIFLAFSKTSFNQNEKRAYEDLVSVCNMGLTHLTLERLGHRELCLRRTFRKYTLSPSVNWLQNWRMKQSMTVYSGTGLFHWPPSEHWRQSLTCLSVMRSFLKQQLKEYAIRMNWLRKVRR